MNDFSPSVIIMSGLLLPLAPWGNWKCFSKGKCFQLSSSFKSSIPMYLLETFRKPHSFSRPHLAMWSLPARMLPRPPHQPGLGMECDHEGPVCWGLGPVSMLCLWAREERNDFFSWEYFVNPQHISKDSKSLIWGWGGWNLRWQGYQILSQSGWSWPGFRSRGIWQVSKNPKDSH